MATPKDEIRILELLENLNKRIDSAEVLNGGFDRLMIEMEMIKKSQTFIEESIQQMKESLYSPQSGIFSKIQTLEHNARNDHDSIVALEQTMDDHVESLNQLRIEIDRLNRFKDNMTRALWLLVPAVFSALANTIYTLFKSAG